MCCEKNIEFAMLIIIGITRKGSRGFQCEKKERERESRKQLRQGGGGDKWSTALFRELG